MIKGSTTLGRIRGLAVDFDAFLEEFGITADEPDSATLSQLGQEYGFEISAVRGYVAAAAQ